jgi:hypothetical protein
MEGDREARLGSASGLNKQSGLKCTGRGSFPHGPGYHRVYGETTKHAPEASVLSSTLSMDGRNREVSLSEPARLLSPCWWVRICEQPGSFSISNG